MINQRYIIKNKIGEGRSKVFSVIDTEFPEKEIAMKVLPANVTAVEKDTFRKEYFTLRKLDHPNIIKAYDFGSILSNYDEDGEIDTGSLFITLAKFESCELLDYPLLKQEDVLTKIIQQICSVLYYLHQSNYIYYDLKPQNILVSDETDKTEIKIIDLGFSRYILSEYDESIRGTAEYIAPELLKKESHDHTVDLYSLGIILYQIIYDTYPFNAKTELEIYKKHIEGNFDFPASEYSEKIISVTKKLLERDPSNRYANSLDVLCDLGIDVNNEIKNDFLPAKVLSGRKDVLNIIQSYLNDKESNEIYSVRGFSGAGKSQVLEELHLIHPNSVYIENSRRKTGAELIRFFLQKLIFSKEVFEDLQEEDRDSVQRLFSVSEIDVSDTLKSLMSRITENARVVLLVDDYNLYDVFAKEAINEIFPILQVNKVKVIIAESSEFDYATEKLHNVQKINITPFTDRQLAEYLDQSYYQGFPKHKLKKVIIDYADLLPGSVIQFIKDILILDVMRYESGEITFVYKGNIEESLRGSNEEIYRMRLSNLSENELKVAQMISAFNISVEQIVLSSVLNIAPKEIEKILLNLQYKNIINPLSLSNTPNIISDGFKRFIYNTIEEKKKYHLIIASLIKRILPEFNIIEHARQYELAGENLRVVELINKEIKRAENLSAYSYKRQLIEDLLKLETNNDIKTSLMMELVKTLYKLSDFNSALEWYEKIDLKTVDKYSMTELMFIYGSSLISVRKISEGINSLNALLDLKVDKSFQQKILIEIAYAEFEQNNYKNAEKIINELITEKEIYPEELGRCYNLLGMIRIYADEDISKSVEFFNKALELYRKAQLPRRVAGVEVNLGNIYNILGEEENAETHWGNALKINESIGNLEQEAAILINYGVYYLFKNKIDKSIQFLSRSDKIFSAIGNHSNQGLVLINLGEVYIQTCEYQKAFDSLNEADNIFKKLQNYEERANALFDLGKLAFLLNNNEMLDQYLTEYESCINNRDTSAKYSINLSLLQLFKDLLNNESIIFNDIRILLKDLLKIGESRNFIEMLIIVFNHFVHKDEFDHNIILEILEDENVRSSIADNYLLNAYCEYFYGKIASVIGDSNTIPPLEHFEKAYSLIENENISELTWQVLSAISESYLERGLMNKAKKPLIYAAELLNYIADDIKKSDLRTKYLSQKERRKVFDNLKLINTPLIAK